MTPEDVEAVLNGLPRLTPAPALKDRVLKAAARRRRRRWELLLVAASLLVFAAVVAVVGRLPPDLQGKAPAGSKADHGALRLPFKVEWEYMFNERRITRVTREEDQLFLETDRGVVALDRFTGAKLWTLGPEMPLDWPPVIAEGVSERIRELEAHLVYLQRKLDDTLREVGPGKETQDLQKKRNEVRELLRVEASGDNVYWVSRQTLYCVDRRKGKLHWTRKLDFAPFARPFAIRDYVFLAEPSAVVLLDVEQKGAVSDRYPPMAPATVTGRPFYSAPYLYFSASDGRVYAYKLEDGSMAWWCPTGRDLKAEPVLHVYRYGGPEQRLRRLMLILYIGGADGFYAIDGLAGMLLWKYDCGSAVRSPADVKDDTIYVKSEEGALHALDMPQDKEPKRVASLRWKLAGGQRFLFKGKETVYVLGSKNEAVAVKEMTGEIVARHRLGAYRHVLSNVVDDHLYVATEDGLVRCLREPRQPKAAGP